MALATPGVASLKPYQPGKPIEELQRELGLRDIIKLASNENPLGAGKRAMKVLRKVRDIARYPDGNCFRLKERLAARHGLDPSQITLGNGSNEILELIARAIVLPQHEIVFSEHAFAVYPLVTQAVGARAVVVPARQWGHDLPAMADAITKKTRLVFVANPNNPTGTWVDEDTLRAFLCRVPDEVIVVLDEAYFDYARVPGYPDASSWINDFSNLLVTRTFSKAHGLASLRIGYGLSHPSVADLLNRVRQPFNVNGVAQTVAEVAIDDADHIAHSVQLNTVGMDYLIKAVNDLDLEHIPSAANFLCINVNRPAREVYEAMLQRGVIIRPVDNYGLPQHIRVSIGLPEENEKFVRVLKEVLGQL